MTVENTNDAMGAMRRLFEEAGLVAPPVPDALRPRVRERGKWFFGTRDMYPMQMYRFVAYLTEAVAGPVEDYMAVSHAGHGVNSYAVNYHLVYGPLAVFAQEGWGGIYTDKERATAEVGRQLTACAELIAAVEAAQRQGGEWPAGRLVVMESPLRGVSACRWLPAPLGDRDAAWSWLREADGSDGWGARPSPFAEAVEQIRSAAVSPPADCGE